MRKSFASVQTISDFIRINNEFADGIDKFKQESETAISNLEYSLKQKEIDVSNVLDKLRNIKDQQTSKYEQLSREASAAQSAATACPSTIKTTSVDENGNAVTKEVSNPQKGAMMANAQQANTAATNAYNFIQEINKAIATLESKLEMVQKALSNIRRIGYSAVELVNSLKSKAQNASNSARKAEQAVSDYKEIRLKRY